MVREHKFDIGTIVEKECKMCKVVRSMRYDGFTVVEADVKLISDIIADEIKVANLLKSENYTCQHCRRTFAYQ